MFFIILCCSCIAAAVNGFKATLYSEIDWKGRSFYVENDECVNLSEDIKTADEGVSSIDTHGLCVVVYDRENCKKTARHIIMRPGTDHHGNFRKLNFNDQAKSIGPCCLYKASTMVPRPIFFYIVLTVINLIVCFATAALVLWAKRRRRPVAPSAPPPPLPISAGESYEMSNYAVYEDIRNSRDDNE